MPLWVIFRSSMRFKSTLFDANWTQSTLSTTTITIKLKIEQNIMRFMVCACARVSQCICVFLWIFQWFSLCHLTISQHCGHIYIAFSALHENKENDEINDQNRDKIRERNAWKHSQIFPHSFHLTWARRCQIAKQDNNNKNTSTQMFFYFIFFYCGLILCFSLL